MSERPTSRPPCWSLALRPGCWPARRRRTRRAGRGQGGASRIRCPGRTVFSMRSPHSRLTSLGLSRLPCRARARPSASVTRPESRSRPPSAGRICAPPPTRLGIEAQLGGELARAHGNAVGDAPEPKLVWLLRERPELVDSARTVLTAAATVSAVLGGRPALNEGDAGSWLSWNRHERCWDDGDLVRAGSRTAPAPGRPPGCEGR